LKWLRASVTLTASSFGSVLRQVKNPATISHSAKRVAFGFARLPVFNVYL
jgi:hypothetical protein